MKLQKLYLFLFLLLFFTPVKSENEYTFYSGIFDTIDKEKDDKATLYGLEHNNPVLFKDTFIGRFSPITGGFITDKDSIFIYTGVQTCALPILMVITIKHKCFCLIEDQKSPNHHTFLLKIDIFVFLLILR